MCCVGRIFAGLVDPVLSAEFTWRLIFYKNNYERRINKNIEGKIFGGIERTLCFTINERWIFSKSQTGGDVGV
jgi:hypothetical protein